MRQVSGILVLSPKIPYPGAQGKRWSIVFIGMGM